MYFTGTESEWGLPDKDSLIVAKNLSDAINGITKGGINMKKKLLFVSLFLLSFLLMSCIFSGKPYLLSIKFTDDKTIEYEFPFALGGDSSGSYSVKNYSITPNDGYRIKVQSYGTITKGQIRWNKDIPDGVFIELDFYDSNDNFILTHSFVKGE